MAASPERSTLESLAVAVEVIAPLEAKAKKRNPAHWVRVVGRQIYNPKNGKTCHQCCLKTTDFAVACNQVKKKDLCTIKYCKSCLLNRYGENAEEVAGKSDWTCPKCRGICHCSFCRNKKGDMPTGVMTHNAKASGRTSVHDLLEKGSDVVAAAQARLKVNADEKGTKRNRGTDVATGEVAIELLLRDESPDASNNTIFLPGGTLVTNIVGAELDNEDTGAAILLCGFRHMLADVV